MPFCEHRTGSNGSTPRKQSRADADTIYDHNFRNQSTFAKPFSLNTGSRDKELLVSSHASELINEDVDYWMFNGYEDVWCMVHSMIDM